MGNNGHAYFIGYRSEKLVQMLVYSKDCTWCEFTVTICEDPIECKNYPRNYLTGPSKGMEASAALDLIKELD